MDELRAVLFEEVLATFLGENPVGLGAYGFALGALHVANEQFRNWTQVKLSLEEILGIMLPHHRHTQGQEIVPQLCSRVCDAIERLEMVPHSDPCWQRIREVSISAPPSVFLSAAPINHPDYADYKGLTDRNYRGLTHLDGLHRFIAWGQIGKPAVVVYLAGHK